MSVYIRKDSKFYWVTLEREGRKAIREATRVPVAGENSRETAERVYQKRMHDLATGRRRNKPLQPNGTKWSFIYFISDGKLVKIGRAVNVLNRLRALQVSHHACLAVLAAILGNSTVEAQIHRYFKDERKRGEWFSMTPKMKKFIAAVNGGQHPSAILANFDHATNHSLAEIDKILGQ